MSPATTTDDRPGSATGRSIRRHVGAVLEPRLGIDPRALAAFRIALGLVVLADLLFVRLPGLATFYTDDGVFPRATLAELFPGFESASLHALSGGLGLQAVLLAIGCLAALALAIGYRTRLATAVTVVFLASLHARNPLVLNGGDTILLSLLFLGLFLSLESRWSVDALRSTDPDADSGTTGRTDRLFSVATATILVHFVTIYAVNGAIKFQSEAWLSGTATARIFQLEQFVVWFGPWVAELGTEFAVLLVAANWAWTALLCGSVLLLVVTDRLRIALVLAFVGAQLGLAATMRLGAFPFVMVAALLLFLPPRVWNRLEATLTASGRDFASVAGSAGRRTLEFERAVLPSSTAWSLSIRSGPGLRRAGRVVASVVLVCFLLAVVGWQLAGAGFVDSPAATPDAVEDASWSFFAPNPPDAYWWYAWEADLEGGETVGTLTGESGAIDRPPDAADTSPSVLWKRYGSELRHAGETPYEPLAAYRCEAVAAAEYDSTPEVLRLYHVEQPVTPDGPVGEPNAEQRLEYEC